MKPKDITNLILLILNVLDCIILFATYFSKNVNPIDNNWLPILGLTYPILLFINIAFIIFWIVRNKRWYLISLTTILLGFGTFSNFFQINFYEESIKAKDEIKVLSYNVRLFAFYEEDKGVKRDKIFKYLVDEAADVMCFQEFYHTENKRGFVTKDSLLKIQDATYVQEKYTHEFRHKQNFGVVTMSRYPIVYEGYIPFEGDINNFCIYSDILLPTQDTIRVYNAHLASIRFQKQDYQYLDGSGKEGKKNTPLAGGKRIINRLRSAFVKRSDQINKVMENVATSPYPTILAGDFNDNPSSYCYSRISDHLNDAFLAKGNGIGSTYNGKLPFLRIDYIFHSEELECLDFDVFREDLSDHFSINSRFKLKDSE